MKDMLLDDTGDLAIVGGDFAIVSGPDSVAQNVLQRLRFFRGEWFLNLDLGVPYFQDILIKRPNPDIVDGILKQAIIGTPGIIELIEFDLGYDNAIRRLTLSFLARSIDGDVTVDDLNVGG